MFLCVATPHLESSTKVHTHTPNEVCDRRYFVSYLNKFKKSSFGDARECKWLWRKKERALELTHACNVSSHANFSVENVFLNVWWWKVRKRADVSILTPPPIRMNTHTESESEQIYDRRKFVCYIFIFSVLREMRSIIRTLKLPRPHTNNNHTTLNE